MKSDDVMLHVFSRGISAHDVQGLPKQEMSRDWFGNALEQPFRWSLARDCDHLWACIQLPARPSDVRRHAAGEFVEGLWEFDVVELFVMNSAGRYQEFNVSVDGAWWAMSFSEYRQRDANSIKPRGVKVHIGRGDRNWQGAISIPLTSLEVELSKESKIHLSGIVHGVTEAQYLSSAGPRDHKPDFHHAGCFLALCERRHT